MDIGLVELMITCIDVHNGRREGTEHGGEYGRAAAAVGAGMAGMVGKSLKAGAGVGARAWDWEPWLRGRGC